MSKNPLDRATIPALKKLNDKQIVFVGKVTQGKTYTDAYTEAYGHPEPTVSTAAMGRALASKPFVKDAIQAVIEHNYPELKGSVASYLNDLVTGAVEARHGERLKAIETLAKLQGWFAPTKSQKLSVNVKDYKLPGTGEKE